MRFDKPLKWSLVIGYAGVAMLFLLTLFFVFLQVSAQPPESPLMVGVAFGIIVSALLTLLLAVAFLIEVLEVATSKKDGFSKALWVVGLIFIPPLVLPLYYFWGRDDLNP